MKGKVLGFTPSSGTGTITGEDGARYGFTQSEWRSDKPIAAGAAVDFEPRGQEAAGIYPVPAAINMGAIDMGALTASPVVGKAAALAKGSLAFPLAILLLIACLLPAVNSASMRGQSLSLLGLGPVVDELAQGAKGAREMAASRTQDLDEREAQINKVIAATGPTTPIGYFGSGGTAGDALKEVQDERAKVAEELSRGTAGSWLLGLMFLVWAVPLLALALIAASWLGTMVRPVSIAAGAAGVVAFALVWNLTRGAELLSLGFGAWVVLILGAGLILAGIGRIRNPLEPAV